MLFFVGSIILKDYREFLSSKRHAIEPAGFTPSRPLNQKLFDWQRAIVLWALRQGRSALFADCGLGKTPMQLEWGSQVCSHTGGDCLILAPLSVASQTQREGAKFGIPVTICRSQSDVKSGINIANYEMLKHFDPKRFAGVVLDESSILKSFMGKTKIAIIEAFRATPYRLACTATPAPNDHMELGNHADFLGVPGANEMLARYFINDPGEAGAYRLKKHAESDFWAWVASWAVSLSKPSDLGFSDTGYVLPELRIHEEIVEVDLTQDTDGLLIRMPSLGATSLHQEMRRTARDRAVRVAEIVATDTTTPWVVWCNTDYESDALRLAMPEAIDLRGSEKASTKERKLCDFSEGRIRLLITKPEIAGYGMNWQHCHKSVVAGLSYSYEDLYQLIHRFHRFGQQHPVDLHIVMAETEGAVAQAIQRKQEDHRVMKQAMNQAMRGSGLLADLRPQALSPVVEDVVAGDDWTLHLGDSCQTIRSFADDSIHLTVTSPPFEDLYIYSDSEADMGNSSGSGEFFEHFSYLIRELYRVTVPGRLACLHCKDLPTYLGRDGASGLRDFPGEIVRAFQGFGWSFHSRVTIWKCPVIERERTNTNGLLHKTVCRDSSQIRQGMADYVLVFRKTPTTGNNLSAEPIVRPGGFRVFVGDSSLDPRESDYHPSPYARKKHASDSSIDVWRRYAEPVWWDVDQMRVLNYKIARDGQDERHICPLQLDVISRCVELWSNPGDLVFDPFNGIGSTGHEALRIGRRYVGVELKPSYWHVASKNLRIAADERRQAANTLFGSLAS